MSVHVTSIVETVFTEWYTTAARWEAPGSMTEFSCTACTASHFRAELGLAEWPHDVTHELLARLTDVSFGVGDLVDDAGVSIDELVLTVVRAHAGDVRDVLVECVEPRLDAYLSQAMDSIDSEFGLLTES